MKLNAFLISGAALTMLSACTSEEIVEPKAQAGNEITFGVTAERASRAAEINTPNHLAFGEFCVSAKVCDAEGTQYFHDVVYKKALDANNWAIKDSDPYYWNSEGLDLFAHVNAEPYDATVTGCQWNNGKPTIGFKVNPDVKQQKDFMVAFKGNVKAESNHNLNFKHALSQVVFQAVNSTNTIEIEIDGISIVNVADNGTFSYYYGEGNNTVITTDNAADAETLQTLPSACWASRGLANASFSCKFTGIKVNSTDKDETGKLEPTNLTNPGVSESNNNAFMMIPQALYCNPEKTKGFHFLVSCRIKQSGKYLWGSEAGGANVLITPSIPTNYATVPVMTWEPGKKYVITFNFDDTAGYQPNDPNTPTLNAITFTVSVDDYTWDNSELSSGIPQN